MFECTGPVMVLHTPTYHPILNTHTGYIFGYYDFHLKKPRELFFQHYYEAVVYAQYVGAKLELDAKATPERLTSPDFLSALSDDSKYINMPDFRQRSFGMYGKTPDSAPDRGSDSAEVLDTPTLDTEDELEWLGDELC